MRVTSFTEVHPGHYPFHNELKDELHLLLEEYDDKLDRTSNVKATMTQWNIISPQIEKLQKYILDGLHKNKFEDKKDQYSKDRSLTLGWTDFWANIYRKGDYTLSHNHGPSVFSLVYFLKSKENYSPLIFTHDNQKVIPKEGTFIIFPGYLFHHVPKHRYNDTRMTLSGNLYFNEITKEEVFKTNVTKLVV